MMAAHQQTAEGFTLSELLRGIVPVPGNTDCMVTGIQSDSRRVQPGDLFLACTGIRHHGLAFVDQAIAAGAIAIAWEGGDADEPDIVQRLAAHEDIRLVRVEGLAARAGYIAARFHGHPSRDLAVTAITGTNGKTSCSQFIAQALTRSAPCGIVGTLGYGLFGAQTPAGHTTPDALHLQELMAEFRDQGARYAVLEASSHGLEQGRILGTSIDVAVFTNLTREHLDYHGDMDRYGQAKQRLFELPGLGHAVINADDPFGGELLSALPESVRAHPYGLCDATVARFPDGLLGHELRLNDAGLRMRVTSPWGDGVLTSPLLGEFNARNLLAVVGVLLVLGIPLHDALERMRHLAGAPGRMERFGGGQLPLVVVDYAHTPDALQQALTALRAHSAGKLVSVFGCGGNRDAGKRPLMGAIAERLSDTVLITDDNPRNEDPQGIVDEILSGIQSPAAVTVEHDREQAIRRAIDTAGPEDLVLVAGKGHEQYQDREGRRLPFSDRAVVLSALGANAANGIPDSSR